METYKSKYGENKPYNYGLNQPNINKPLEKKQNAIEVNKDNKVAPKLNHEISSQYRNEKNRLYNPNNIRSEGDRPRYLSEDKRNIQRMPVYQNYIQEKEKEQNRNNINQKNEAGIRVNRFHANVNQNNDNVIKKPSYENIQNKYNNGVDINNLLNTINIINECDINYNLQPREIKECYNNNSSYQNDIYMKLNLSFTDNDKIRTCLIDNENMFLDNLNFYFNDMKKLNQSAQKDLYIKKIEKVIEDNFIFELTKEDDKNIIENIEKEDNEIKNMRDINKEGAFDIRKEQKINLENKFRAIKKKWMSLVPTYIEYINSGIKNPSNKLLP